MTQSRSRKRKLEQAVNGTAPHQSPPAQSLPEPAAVDSDIDNDTPTDNDDNSDEVTELTTNATITDADALNTTDFDCPVRVFVGTYTGALYGLETVSTVRQLAANVSENEADSDSDAPTFLTLFATAAHRGSIRALSTSPNHHNLVTAGVDEVMQLYDLSMLRHTGSLHRHSASIDHLVFPTPSTFLSCTSEGLIGVWSASHRWEMIGRLTGGKSSGIDSVSVHPSNKALITSHSDTTIRVFDLIHGKLLTSYRRPSAILSITEGGSGRLNDSTIIRWCDDGSHYALVVDRTISIYNSNGKLIFHDRTLLKSRALSVIFLALETLVVGCENGSINVIDVRKNCVRVRLTQHSSRVRCLERLRVTDADSSSEVVLVVSGSTDGQVYLWNFTPLAHTDSDTDIVPVAGAKSEARITALAASLQYQPRHFVPASKPPSIAPAPPQPQPKQPAKAKKQRVSNASDGESASKRQRPMQSRQKLTEQRQAKQPTQSKPGQPPKTAQTKRDKKTGSGSVTIVSHKKRSAAK